MKLGLGTVQFGVPYGVANARGKLSDAETGRVIDLAVAAGIEMIDTASGYGDAEEVLGRALPSPNPFRLVTKTPAFRTEVITASHGARLRNVFLQSLDRLRVSQVYGLLLHHADDLLVPGGEHILEVMRDLVAEGRVERVGVSVYCGAQIDALLARFKPDMIQLPASIVDRRLIESGHIARLKAANTEVHVRSAFLQGAVLMASNGLPEYLDSLRDYIEVLDATAASLGLSRLQLALGYLRGIAGIDHVIVGVASANELKQIVNAFRNLPERQLIVPPAPAYDESVLNPSNWPQS